MEILLQHLWLIDSITRIVGCTSGDDPFGPAVPSPPKKCLKLSKRLAERDVILPRLLLSLVKIKHLKVSGSHHRRHLSPVSSLPLSPDRSVLKAQTLALLAAGGSRQPPSLLAASEYQQQPWRLNWEFSSVSMRRAGDSQC